MATDVQICNQALGWLGQGPIVSLDGSTGRTAELCATNYPLLRDAVMESRCWTFATYRATSTSVSEIGSLDACSPVNQSACEGYPEWGNGWVHPIDPCYMKVFRVYRHVGSRRPEDWIDATWWREGSNILAVEQTVYMWGVRQITDTARFSSLFTQALAARLAADLAMPITQNVALQRDMWGLYEAKLDEAAARDGQQGQSEQLQSNTLLEARQGGGIH